MPKVANDPSVAIQIRTKLPVRTRPSITRFNQGCYNGPVRIALLAAVVVALASAVSSSATNGVRVASHCSPSGDVCYGIFRQVREVYRFELTLAARYFRRYQICVKPDTAGVRCKSFPVGKRGRNFGGTVIWNRYYPNKGTVGYTVTWKQSGRRLGPSLRFRELPLP